MDQFQKIWIKITSINEFSLKQVSTKSRAWLRIFLKIWFRWSRNSLKSIESIGLRIWSKNKYRSASNWVSFKSRSLSNFTNHGNPNWQAEKCFRRVNAKKSFSGDKFRVFWINESDRREFSKFTVLLGRFKQLIRLARVRSKEL